MASYSAVCGCVIFIWRIDEYGWDANADVKSLCKKTPKTKNYIAKRLPSLLSSHSPLIVGIKPMSTLAPIEHRSLSPFSPSSL
jgi:hypothetical protein